MLFFSNVTRGVDAEKKIDDLFSPKTLTQIGVPAVLELLEDSERFEDHCESVVSYIHVYKTVIYRHQELCSRA